MKQTFLATVQHHDSCHTRRVLNHHRVRLAMNWASFNFGETCSLKSVAAGISKVQRKAIKSEESVQVLCVLSGAEAFTCYDELCFEASECKASACGMWQADIQ
eukprot:scaffold120_cov134-Skeletonema_dohrnii-CCMP3373.AAC.4